MAASDYEVETIESSKLRDLVLIGEGGFGEVYRAMHSDWGPVAFKKLTVTFIKPNERVATELRREIGIHSKLRHQNIVILMGVVFEIGNYGVILEFATQGDLWNFTRRFHPVPWQWKLSMASGIVLGMNYLHTATRRPLIHADLKMKNVLVSDGFKPKISDFGLSRWKRYSYELTRRESPGGTVTHIPPENWRDINTCPTEKYDVYSFGILLWELLSERHPFYGVDTNSIKDAVLNGERPQLYFIPADIPDFLKQIISECWAQEPQARPLFNALKPQFERHVNEHNNAIQVAKQQLQQRESHVLPAGETARFPAPNVPTGGVPVGVDDPGTRPPYSVKDTGLSYIAVSRPPQHQHAVLPLLPQEVRTNYIAVNVQPANSDFSLRDMSAAAPLSQQSVDLHPIQPDQSFRSDLSVGQQMENMELSSGEEQPPTNERHPQDSQAAADDAMDQ